MFLTLVPGRLHEVLPQDILSNIEIVPSHYTKQFRVPMTCAMYHKNITFSGKHLPSTVCHPLNNLAPVCADGITKLHHDSHDMPLPLRLRNS